jgi:hypothetical protein
MGLAELAIWLPIVSGGVLLALGRDEHARMVRWLALIASSRASSSPAADQRLRPGTAAMQFQEKLAWIDRFNVATRSASTACRVVRAADRLHHGDRRDLRMAGHHRARQPVHGRVPDPVGPDGRRLRALDGLLFYVFFERR